MILATCNLAQAEDVSRNIIFFGDSLTAGYGLTTDEAYPKLIQDKLKQAGYRYKVINSGVSGDTSADGLSRLSFLPLQEILATDVFVLALGANDGLRGLPTKLTHTNLAKIIQLVREKNPKVKVILAGMQVPTNLGVEYCEDFKKIYFDIKEVEGVELIPFLLEGVAGLKELNQDDGIHPNEKGQQLIAENVWKVLKLSLKQP